MNVLQLETEAPAPVKKPTSKWSDWRPVGKLPNPGKYEELNKESKEILGNTELFDGVRVEVNRGASENFGVTHSMSLGSVQDPPSYNFSTTYLDKSTLLLGRIDTSGQLIGRFQQNLSDKFIFRAVGQASLEPHTSGFHTEVDYQGDSSYSQLKWTSPGAYAISYLKSVTEHLSLGCDAFYNYKQAFSMATFGARYATDQHIFTAIGTLGMLNASYTRKVGAKTSLATEIMLQHAQNGWESLYTVGYKYQFTNSAIKGTISSDGRVTAVFEENLNPAAKFTFAANLDHKKQDYRFGFGVSINM